MEILSSFTHHRVVQNLEDFLPVRKNNVVHPAVFYTLKKNVDWCC